MFSRFDTIHACDRRTAGQTDGIAVHIHAIALYAVARKNAYGSVQLLLIYGSNKLLFQSKFHFRRSVKRSKQNSKI